MTEAALQDESSHEQGPTTLRDALKESFEELSGDDATEPTVNDDEPTESSPEPSTDEVVEAAGAEPSEDEESQGSEPEVIQAPEHWSAEDQATFTGLPREAQDYLLRREKQYEQGIQKKAEELKPLQEAFGPYREILKMRGIDEQTAIRSWVNAQAMLDRDPVGGLKMLIQQYGPEVQSAMRAEFGEVSTDDSEFLDTEDSKLRKELAETRKRAQEGQAQFAQIRQEHAVKQIVEFKEAKDDQGNLLHPYFDEAQDSMRALLAAGAVPDLESAYEKAVWSVEAYRQDVVDKERSAAKKEAEQKREEAAKKAKKTATGVSGKSSVPPPKSKPKTLRDDLAEAFKLSVKGEL